VTITPHMSAPPAEEGVPLSEEPLDEAVPSVDTDRIPEGVPQQALPDSSEEEGLFDCEDPRKTKEGVEASVEPAPGPAPAPAPAPVPEPQVATVTSNDEELRGTSGTLELVNSTRSITHVFRLKSESLSWSPKSGVCSLYKQRWTRASPVRDPASYPAAYPGSTCGLLSTAV
jgi:hypothetical protein